MKLFIALLLISLVPPACSFGQDVSATVFAEDSYTLISKEVNLDEMYNRYVILYKNKSDSRYTMKKVYQDSTYAELISKSFLKEGVLEGPIVMYNNGKVSLKGRFKNGTWDGERLTYVGEQLIQKAYFIQDINIGTWEVYNTSGKLIRKTTYDTSGNVSADQKF